MPQAASVNNDHARAQRQTGQKFHRAQSNKRSPAGQPSIFNLFIGKPADLANPSIATAWDDGFFDRLDKITD